jgi:steroid 5-alpha reductase family enzyme
MDVNQEVALWRARNLVTTAYFVAFVLAVAVAFVVPGSTPLWTGLRADVAATLAIFVFSFMLGNSSMYDPYWSVAPPLLVGGWILTAMDTGSLVRQGLVLMVTVAWGTRLTVNWQRGWTGLHHEDWRYVQLRQQTGPLYWLVSLAGLHFFPTLIVFLALWPAYEAVTEPSAWQTYELIGPVVCLIGTLLEGTADNQLAAFRARSTDPHEVIREGLWAWSRHPNYLGEITFWWGLWLTAFLADWQNALTVLGALAITAMFRFISIPMMEKRMLEKRAGYRHVVDEVSMIVPWPVRRRS